MNTHLKNLGMLGAEYRHEKRPIIIDLSDPQRPVEIDYPSYHANCDAVARGLLARGLQKGQKIGLLASNSAWFIQIYYGAMRVGIVPVLINFQLTQDNIAWVISNSDVELVFCDESLLAKCPPAVHHLIIDSSEFQAFLDPGTLTPIVPAEDDVAFHVYTSGSTGKPKGAIISHRAHLFVAHTISKGREFCPSDRMIVAAPLYHMHAQNSMQCVLVGGSSVILMKKFDARIYVEAITRYRVTVVSGVPTIYAMMLQQRDLLAGKDYSFVRLATMGGAPASDVLVDEVATHFSNAKIVKIFGITETGSALFGPHPQGLPRPRHSIGFPIAGNEFRLVESENENFGVLEVKSPGMMNGYQKNPGENAKRFRNGWYYTGDVLRRDEIGWYYFVGRSDDMFVSGGNNIYPLEVELMLERHADIEQAVVVPIADDIKHTLPVSFIVRRKGSVLTEADIKQHALSNGPPYQHPRRVYFVDSLPLNTIGKIDRKVLEDQAKQLAKETSQPESERQA